ncbi:Lrp/AsnC ligand binding domain-containing protein [Thalassotalea sp. PS06]|uniref:Lrp/AsnC ligand binding domain-containing protein n=1 Tax=Thalassotalea sp. PS06 TaxID=2594005 RepID=UPI0028C4BBA4|nr:Lrp/AsnC ligand binding domain-containing protein [Thalassotalea sp. PS06]
MQSLPIPIPQSGRTLSGFGIKECHNITGAFEYLLWVETSDLVAYKVFYTLVLVSLPQVHSITTYVVMESVKENQ